MSNRNPYAFQREFAQFTTKNVLSFSDNTYFLASLTTDVFGDVQEFLLYPGGKATFRDDADNIPKKFLDPCNPQTIHPDLQINIRRKAHRFFHEKLLGHRISLGQTLLPNPSANLYMARGGGAVLQGKKLKPKYKSGVLNGKWSLPFIGEDLEYGQLPKQDITVFNKALHDRTGLELTMPTIVPTINSPSDTQNRGLSHNYFKNRAKHNVLNYKVPEKDSILTPEERGSLNNLKGDELKTKILDFITIKFNTYERNDLADLISMIEYSGEYSLLKRRQAPSALGRLFKPETDSITTLNQMIARVVEQESLTWSEI